MAFRLATMHDRAAILAADGVYDLERPSDRALQVVVASTNNQAVDNALEPLVVATDGLPIGLRVGSGVPSHSSHS